MGTDVIHIKFCKYMMPWDFCAAWRADQSTAPKVMATAPATALHRVLATSKGKSKAQPTASLSWLYHKVRAAQATAPSFVATVMAIQGCESRRQTNSSSSRPRFREIWKVSSLSRSLPLSGKKVSPRSRPRSSFSRHPPAENENSIAVRGSRPPPPCSVFSARIYRKNAVLWIRIRDPGSGIRDPVSGIRDKHPGSATLKKWTE